MASGASVGVRDLPLTVAGLALNGIDFTTWLRWLLHDRVARSIAGGADVIFDLWCHRTFEAAQLAALNSEIAYGLCKTIQITKTRAPIIQRRTLGSWVHFQSIISFWPSDPARLPLAPAFLL